MPIVCSRLGVSENGDAIQALCPDHTHVISGEAAASVMSGEFQYSTLRLYATVDMHVKFGNSTVVATLTDMYIKAGIQEYFYLGDNDSISCIKAGESSGQLYITEMY